MILVCGEALIELFTTSDGLAGPILKPAVGGSPFNVAAGLARLENPVAFFGGLSLDYFGTPQAHPSYTFYTHDSAEQDVRLAGVSRPRGADWPRLADIEKLMVAQSNGPEK